MKYRPALLVFVGLMCIGFLHAQHESHKTIRGITSNERSGRRIAGVRIISEMQNDSAITNSAGKFRLSLPKDYYKTITFFHPAYHPYQMRIRKGDPMKLQHISMIPSPFILDTLFYPSFPGNRMIAGYVITETDHTPIENAVIKNRVGQRIQYTDGKGYFKATIPESEEYLVVSGEGYRDRMVQVRLLEEKKLGMRIALESQDEGHAEDWWKGHRNFLGLMANELITGSVGIHYERFMAKKHAIGLKTSYYLYGWLYMPLVNSSGTSHFHGIKAAPFYRFYYLRNPANGTFVEGKAILGYFDLYEMIYEDPYQSYYSMTYSTTDFIAGFGISLGYEFTDRQKWRFSISGGFQYYPLDLPKELTHEHGYKLEPSDQFWYFGGPGSYLEVKIILGRIF